jgi:hypothetical protein
MNILILLVLIILNIIIFRLTYKEGLTSTQTSLSPIQTQTSLSPIQTQASLSPIQTQESLSPIQTQESLSPQKTVQQKTTKKNKNNVKQNTSTQSSRTSSTQSSPSTQSSSSLPIENTIKNGLEITGPISIQGKRPPTISGTILKCAGNASDYFMIVKNKIRKFPSVFTASTWDKNYITADSYDCNYKDSSGNIGKTIDTDNLIDSITLDIPGVGDIIRCKKDYLNNETKYYKVKSDEDSTLIFPYETSKTGLTKLYDCDKLKDSSEYFTEKLLRDRTTYTNYISSDDSVECDGVNIEYNGVYYCFPYNGPVIYDVRDIFEGDMAVINTGRFVLSGIDINKEGPQDTYNIKGSTVIDNFKVKFLQVYSMEDKNNNNQVIFPIKY